MNNKKKKISLTTTMVCTFIIIMAVIIFFCFLISKYVLRDPKDININEVKQEYLQSENFEEIIGKTFMRVVYVSIGSFICGIILVYRTGKTIIRPIKELSNATQKVSKGNFDIELQTLRQDELGELIENFNKMTSDLKKQELLQKDFINSVSHEFKTPISSIQGVTQLLESGNLSEEEKQEYLEIIKEETTRLFNLSSDILRLSKIENQEKLQNQEEYNLSEQIRKCILLLEPNWTKKNIEFDIKLKDIKINAEKELLQLVWINLLGNAIKFSNENGTIKVLSKIQENSVIVEIIDNGIGIKEEHIERIFDRFYQADSSHSKDGNGLGLAIVKKVINLCNGAITVESEFGKGTNFIVRLPIIACK